MLKQLLPRRWRRLVQRQGLQGAQAVEALALDVHGALARYRRREVNEEELRDLALEAALLAVLRLLLEEP